MKTTVEHYVHHGKWVAVRSDLKGTHRDHCLCMRDCIKFKPGKPDHCPIAAAVFANCVKYKLCTPVFECPEYKEAPQAYDGYDETGWNWPVIISWAITLGAIAFFFWYRLTHGI